MDSEKISALNTIKNFFKTDFYFFIKNYLYFIVLFTICFYILLYVNKNAKSKSELVITKIFFYLLIIFLFMIISDILETPLELQQKFILIIFSSLIFTYIINLLIEHFYKDKSFYSNLLRVFVGSLIIYVSTVISVYFTFQKKNADIAMNLYNSFNYAIGKNLSFLIFIFIYLFVYQTSFMNLTKLNSSLSSIICPAVLGFLLILFIFIFIIYIANKMKIINKFQYLNTFIALSAIFVFLSLNYAHIFLSSLSTICKEKVNTQSVDNEERYSILLLISIFIILWYDDTRNWHTQGSILFVLASLFGLYCMFYYSTKHPSLGLLSFWFFIEWIIIIFYKKQNSRNSLHFSFMDF